jgi:hypothetical protein
MFQIKVRNLESISAKLASLPYGTRGAATMAAAKVIIGNQNTGLQHYPERKVHGEGNPYKWNSDKQRRAYFATNGFGRGIPSVRSFDLRFGWQVVAWDGTRTRITNKVPYADFVQGDLMQVGHKADGWRNVAAIIASNHDAMMLEIDRAVHRYFVSKGVA